MRSFAARALRIHIIFLRFLERHAARAPCRGRHARILFARDVFFFSRHIRHLLRRALRWLCRHPITLLMLIFADAADACYALRYAVDAALC